MRRNKLKTVILVSFALIISIIIFSSFFFLSRNKENVLGRIHQAEALKRSGNYNEAKHLFELCVTKDRGNEAAWVSLGEIYESENNWSQSSRCWGHAYELNALNNEYYYKVLYTLYRGHRFRDFLHLSKRDSNLPPELRDAYALCLFMTSTNRSEISRAKETVNAKGEMADFIDLLAKENRVADIFEHLKRFTNAADPVIAEEALLQIYNLAYQNKDNSTALISLQQVVKRNPQYSFMLGDFYFFLKDYQNASLTYKSASNFLLSTNSVQNYASILFQQQQKKELKKLEELLRSGNKNSMCNAAYIRAMIAFLDKDYHSLELNLNAIGNSIQTPISSLLHFVNAAKHSDAKEMEQSIVQLNQTPKHLQKETWMFNEAMAVMSRYYKDGKFKEAAPLARLFYTYDTPNLLIVRILLLSDADTHSSQILQNAVKNFPNDPIVCHIALNNAQYKNNYDEMLDYSERLRQSGNQTVSSDLCAVTALEGKRMLKDAEKRLMVLLDTPTRNRTVLIRALTFAIRNSNSTILEKVKDDSEFKKIAKLFLLRINNREKYLAELQKNEIETGIDYNKVEDRELLLILAINFAVDNQEKRSIKIYEEIRKYIDDKTIINMNLSELYSSIGEYENALNYAKDAYLSNSQDHMIRICYGLRLVESEKWKDAVFFLDSEITNDYRVKPALIKALKKYIEEIQASKINTEYNKYIQRLKELDPDYIHHAESITK